MVLHQTQIRPTQLTQATSNQSASHEVLVRDVPQRLGVSPGSGWQRKAVVAYFWNLRPASISMLRRIRYTVSPRNSEIRCLTQSRQNAFSGRDAMPLATFHICMLATSVSRQTARCPPPPASGSHLNTSDSRQNSSPQEFQITANVTLSRYWR